MRAMRQLQSVGVNASNATDLDVLLVAETFADGVGDPCEADWWGVTCCAVDAPLYRPDDDPDKPCFAVDGSDRREATRSGDTLYALGGCGSGFKTGYPEFDNGKCVVVRLTLTGNNLTGTLPESLARLSYLQYLDVSYNSLHSAFPKELALRARNTFPIDYEKGSFELRTLRIGWQYGVGFDTLFGLSCANAFPGCTGMPPKGCTAYGSKSKISSADINSCIICGEPIYARLLVGALILSFLLMMTLYAYLIINFPEKLTQMTSTASIFIGHLQTTSLLGKLQLIWPPTTKTAIGLLSVDGFSFEAARPECMFDETDEVGSQLRLLKIAVPLGMILFMIFIRMLVRPVVVRLVHAKYAIVTRCCIPLGLHRDEDPPPPPPTTPSFDDLASGRSSWTTFTPRFSSQVSCAERRGSDSSREASVHRVTTCGDEVALDLPRLGLSRAALHSSGSVTRRRSSRDAAGCPDRGSRHRDTRATVVHVPQVTPRTAQCMPPFPETSPRESPRESPRDVPRARPRRIIVEPPLSSPPPPPPPPPSPPGADLDSSLESSVGMAPWQRDSRNNPLGQKGTKPLPRFGMNRRQRREADLVLHDKLNGVEDKVALFETMVVSLMMVSSWQVIYDYLYIAGLGKNDELGMYFAIFLMLCELVLFYKYLRDTRAMVISDRARRRRLSNLPTGRLRNRMRFIGKRFAPHASYWQFVVWIRQFIVWITTIIPTFTKQIDVDAVSNVTVIDTEETLADLATTALADSSQKPNVYAAYTSACIALLVFILFMVYHIRVYPYVYAFQNYVESGLFCVSIITVFLAILYSALYEVRLALLPRRSHGRYRPPSRSLICPPCPYPSSSFASSTTMTEW